MRGTVRDSATRQPIPGAVLTLLDSSSGVIGRVLTNARGQYSILRSDGTRRLRIQRLGFRFREVAVPAAAPGNDVLQVDVAMVPLPTLLEPVRVVAGANCPRRSDSDAAFALLEQARAGLLTTVVARQANPGKLVRLAFERRMDGASDRIMSQKVHIDSADRETISFQASHTGADFVQRGFADDHPDGAVFYGPDAEVLLDDGFANGYCFRITDPDGARPNQIGLGFAPADHKRDRVDIEGALWIDTVARALRDIEYRYAGLSRDMESIRPGGHTFFREMTNGVVLIDRWDLRLPKLEADTSYDRKNNPQIRYWFSAIEGGGELASAMWPDGTVWRASLGTLRVHARIHTDTAAAAAGVAVRLADTDYRAVADSNGDFVIGDLVPGPYALTVLEPHLAEFGITSSPALKFAAARDSTVERILEVRTMADYIVDRCLAEHPRASRAFLVLGRVETPYGLPVKDAKVTMSTPLPGATAEALPFYEYTTGSDGVFQACLGDSFRRESISIRARRGGAGVNVLRTLTETVALVHLVLDPPPAK